MHICAMMQEGKLDQDFFITRKFENVVRKIIYSHVATQKYLLDIFFRGHQSVSFSYLYSCFGLLVISALYFKAKVDSTSCMPSCNRFLRFTSSVAPSDLLVASMTAEPFHPHTCVQQLVGFESRIKHVTTQKYFVEF